MRYAKNNSNLRQKTPTSKLWSHFHASIRSTSPASCPGSSLVAHAPSAGEHYFGNEFSRLLIIIIDINLSHNPNTMLLALVLREAQARARARARAVPQAPSATVAARHHPMIVVRRVAVDYSAVCSALQLVATAAIDNSPATIVRAPTPHRNKVISTFLVAGATR